MAARICWYFYQCAMDLTRSLHKWDRLETYSHFSLVLFLKMLDSNFFNWLLSNHLPKVIEKGFDQIVLVNMVRVPCMLENDVFL